MEKKNCPCRGVIGLLMLFIMGAAFADVLIAADWPEGVPEELTIKDPAYQSYKKGPVKFPHKMHFVKNKLACETCHHVYENGKNVWKPTDKVQRCAECHPFDENKGKQYKVKMGTVFHNKCRACHKEQKKGPAQCNECHQEKS